MPNNVSLVYKARKDLVDPTRSELFPYSPGKSDINLRGLHYHSNE
ncbi:hypothetical protein [uncultured Mucilaginibacter sp.]|nr:hypothetical protein [uncultured Mucilaginibacter sp.]